VLERSSIDCNRWRSQTELPGSQRAQRGVFPDLAALGRKSVSQAAAQGGATGRAEAQGFDLFTGKAFKAGLQGFEQSTHGATRSLSQV
jgi:hypothetical protein